MSPRARYRNALGVKLEMLKTAGGLLADPGSQAMETIRDMAHALSRSADAHGFPDLSAAARALEDAAKPDFQGRLEALTGMMEKIKAESEKAETLPDGPATEAAIAAEAAVAAAAAETQAARPSAPGAEKGNILLADDDEVVATIVVQKLEREGFKVRHVSDGDAALRAASKGGYSLFIFDVSMPGMDGFDLLSSIKDLPGCKQTPVLMLTGKRRGSDVRTGIQLGADDYMLKPFLPYELASRVRKLLSRKGSPEKG